MSVVDAFAPLVSAYVATIVALSSCMTVPMHVAVLPAIFVSLGRQFAERHPFREDG